MQEVAEAQPVPQVKGKLTRRGRAYICGDHEKENHSKERISAFQRMAQRHPWFGGLSIFDLFTIWETDKFLRHEAWKAICARRRVPTWVWCNIIHIAPSCEAPEYVQPAKESLFSSLGLEGYSSSQLKGFIRNRTNPQLDSLIVAKIINSLEEHSWDIVIDLAYCVKYAPEYSDEMTDKFTWLLGNNRFFARSYLDDEKIDRFMLWLLDMATTKKEKLAHILCSRGIITKDTLLIITVSSPELASRVCKKVVDSEQSTNEQLRAVIVCSLDPELQSQAAERLSIADNQTGDDYDCLESFQAGKTSPATSP